MSRQFPADCVIFVSTSQLLAMPRPYRADLRKGWSFEVQSVHRNVYPYPLRWVFRWAREAGYHGVELLVNPEAINRGGVGARQLADEEGVEIFSVHPTVVPIPGWREHRDGLEPTILLAQKAGAGMVVMHTPRFLSLDDDDGQAFQRWIESWQSRLAGGDLRLTMENKAVRDELHQSYALTPLVALRAFADRYNLGLVLDTTHAHTAGEDLLQAQKTFNGRLANVHLSDMGGRFPLSSNPRAQQWLGEHRLPGAGDLPLVDSSHRSGPGGIWWTGHVRGKPLRATRLVAAGRSSSPGCDLGLAERGDQPALENVFLL